MEKIDPDLASNPLIFPDDAMLAKSQGLHGPDREAGAEYEAKFQKVIGA